MQKMSLSRQSRNELLQKSGTGKIPFDILNENKIAAEKMYGFLSVFDGFAAVEQSDKSERYSVISENRKEYTFSYMKNSFTDESFSVFSSYLPKCKVKYSENYGNSCEDVYYGRADCCILPVESSDEGIISGFNSMLEKYELRLGLTCNIEDREGHFTKYALIKRNIGLIDIECDSDIYLRMYCTPLKNSGELSELIFGGEHFGLVVGRIDSVPKYYSENEYLYDIVFAGKDIQKVNGFLTWLEKTGKSFDLQSVYRHIK